MWEVEACARTGVVETIVEVKGEGRGWGGGAIDRRDVCGFSGSKCRRGDGGHFIVRGRDTAREGFEAKGQGQGASGVRSRMGRGRWDGRAHARCWSAREGFGRDGGMEDG